MRAKEITISVDKSGDKILVLVFLYRNGVMRCVREELFGTKTVMKVNTKIPKEVK